VRKASGVRKDLTTMDRCLCTAFWSSCRQRVCTALREGGGVSRALKEPSKTDWRSLRVSEKKSDRRRHCSRSRVGNCSERGVEGRG
jgi:hypothetical protein